MNDVRTNILDLEWCPESIEQKYQVYALRSQSPKYWMGLRDAADKVFANGNILSACYFDEYGKKGDDRRCVHLLLCKDDRNDELMAELVDSLGDDFTCESIDDLRRFIEDHERIMVQLLINSLQSDTGSNCSFINLSGKYFCIDSRWMNKNSFMALEFRVENAQGLDELVLSMNVRSFNRIKNLKLSPEQYQRIMSSPQYIVEGLLPKRVFNRNKNNFIMKQRKKGRNKLTFLKMDKYEDFRKSKVGYLFNLVDLFNTRYGQSSGMMMCDMEFKTIEETASRSFTKKTIDEFDAWIKGQVSGQTVNVIDLVSDESSSAFSDLIRSRLESFEAKVSMPCSPAHGAMNICIIHGADYYEENNLPDRHNEFQEYGVQHIVIDDCNKDENSIDLMLMVMITEMSIKKDIVGPEHRMTVDDWSCHGFKTDLTFMQLESVGDDDDKRKLLHSMTIRPDGSFDIHSKDVTEEYSDQYRKLWTMEENDKDSKGEVEGMVMDGNGNINVILHSNIITIPESGVVEALKANRKVRNKEFKKNGLRGLLDLRMLDHDGELMYYSGSIAYSLRSSVPTAPNIRIVKPVRGELFFDDLIDLMNVPFVKYKRIASKPYPFKYLEEYRMMHNDITDESY